MRLLPMCLLMSLLAGTACQTTGSGEAEKPKITRDMPLSESYPYAITFGGDTLLQVKEFAREKQQFAELHKLTAADLAQKHESMNPIYLLNVAHLYRVSTPNLDPQLLRTLVLSRSEPSRRIGWRLAATKPSAEVGQMIEQILTEALSETREEKILAPEMATAIQENNLKSSYTFLARGLLLQGNPEYANAMLALDPVRAAGPFLDYLGKADFDDLRQLNQENINVYSCTLIFRYFLDNPLPINHPAVAQLFMFAVSRNRGLADMANAVLDKHIPEHRVAMARILSRTPTQVQLAFVEGSQRELTSNLRLLLSSFKESALEKQVLEELESGQRDVAQ